MLEIYATYPRFVNATYFEGKHEGYAPRMGNDSKHTSDEKKAIGARLASARALAEMNQLDAATRIGITKAALSAWETGRNLPDALMVRKLAKTYRVTADALLWDDSLTLDAIKFAAEYDSLTDEKRKLFTAMWKAFFAEAASDDRVGKTYRPIRYGSDESRPDDRHLGGTSGFGDLDEEPKRSRK